MQLFLAQTVTTFQALEQAVGHAIGILIILGYAYAVVVLISALIQERADGTWKMGIIRAIGIFSATGICQILLTIFFPAVQIPVSFN